MAEQPTYVGRLPWMAQWWLDHLDTAPLVAIRCGRGEPPCRIAIGEVKRDGDVLMAMRKNEYPEAETRWLADPSTEGLSPEIAAELAAAIAERDAGLLRSYDDGRMVHKRKVWPRDVALVSQLDSYVCRLHGEVEVDIAHLEQFARDTTPPTRTYLSQT